MIPKFQDLIERLSEKKTVEVQDKQQKLQKDVDKQLESTMGPANKDFDNFFKNLNKPEDENEESNE